MIANEHEDEERRRLAELSALVHLRLGKELDDRTFRQLASIQWFMRKTQEDLRQALDLNQITPETYLTKFQDVLKQAMLESEKLLGTPRFDALFGKAGRQPEGIADRDAFFKSQLSLRSR
jgi:hypothetical protein